MTRTVINDGTAHKLRLFQRILSLGRLKSPRLECSVSTAGDPLQICRGDATEAPLRGGSACADKQQLKAVQWVAAALSVSSRQLCRPHHKGKHRRQQSDDARARALQS